MHCRLTRAAACPNLRTLAVAALLATPLFATATGARGQTLAAPNPPPKWAPSADRKSRASDQVKSCSAYGAGFVNVPGTDACVKIGGWVAGEAGAR